MRTASRPIVTRCAVHLRLRGLDPDENIVIAPAGDSRFLDEGEIVKALANPEVQMALFPSVVYTPGSSSIWNAFAAPRARMA
jgi:hypothetical protein